MISKCISIVCICSIIVACSEPSIPPQDSEEPAIERDELLRQMTKSMADALNISPSYTLSLMLNDQHRQQAKYAISIEALPVHSLTYYFHSTEVPSFKNLPKPEERPSADANPDLVGKIYSLDVSIISGGDGEIGIADDNNEEALMASMPDQQTYLVFACSERTT